MGDEITGNTTTREARMAIGEYVLAGVLGEGGSAIVFEATDKSGRPVALKVLRPDLALGPREQQRFIDEAARLRSVRHPSIVEILDSGVLPDGRPFIAMPCLRGQSLLERLRMGPIRFDVALTLFEQLADALRALHQARLVHRDIKPANIFVAEGDTRALLLDLGIAREVGADPTTTTRAGLIRGTPAYMAPERFFGKPATPATDIYELAVVFYLVLVGSLPWDATDDPTARLHPVPPAQRGVVLPPRLTETLMRALSGQPQLRPASTEEFTDAVSDAVSPRSAALIGAQQTTSVRPTTQPLAAVASVREPSGLTKPPRVVPLTLIAPRPAPFALPSPSAATSPPPTFVPVAAPSPPIATRVAPSHVSAGLVLLVAVGFIGLLLTIAVVAVPVLRSRQGGASREQGGSNKEQRGASDEQRGATDDQDLPCCRTLNEFTCAITGPPCQPSVDIESTKRSAPRAVLKQINENCCTALENVKAARRRR